MVKATLQQPSPVHVKGQRLHCLHCGSEIEVVNPSLLEHPTQVFRCCGADMQPEVGRDINLGDE